MREVQAQALWVLRQQWDEELGATRGGSGSARFVSALTSTMAAYAYSRHAPRLAMRELSRVLSFQRADGLVPAYAFPVALDRTAVEAFYEAEVPYRANATSPLAALPLQAAVALKIYESSRDRRLAGDWALSVVPKLAKWHSYLRTQRQVDNVGGVQVDRKTKNANLVRLRHPYESTTRRSGDVLFGDVIGRRPPPPPGQEDLDFASFDKFFAVDVEFNAALAWSEESFEALLAALERRRLLRAKDYRSEQGTLDLEPLWIDGAYRSLYSFDNGTSFAPSAASTIADLAGSLLVPVSAEKRDALVAKLVDHRTADTFDCPGRAPPVPDLGGCGAYSLGGGAAPLARPLDNLLLQRGLLRAQQDALADFIRDSTVQTVLKAPGRRVAAKNYATPPPPLLDLGENDDDNDLGGLSSPPPLLWIAFYEAYDDRGVGLGNNASALAAAACIAITTEDATDADYPDPPVSRGIVFAIVAIELTIAAVVAGGCLLTNLLLIRALQHHDAPDTFFSEITQSPHTTRRRRYVRFALADDAKA